MIYKPRHCVRCGCELWIGQFQSPKYNELELELDNGLIEWITICNTCPYDPETEDRNDLYDALCAVQLRPGPMILNRRNTFLEYLERVQDGKCAKCHTIIADTWKISDGRMYHETC